jgi:hypothetical protein
MALNRLTVDISDGNSTLGPAFGQIYDLYTSIPVGQVITEIHIKATWDTAPATNATNITTYTLAERFPYNVTLQFGAHGFSPVSPSRSNYSNSAFLELLSVPVEANTAWVFPGSSDVFTVYTADWELRWVGELHVTALSDLVLLTYAGHQAAPQAQFQQGGTANIWFNA